MNVFEFIWHKLFPVNVASIVGNLQKTVNKLENASAHHIQKIDAKSVKVVKLEADIKAHAIESSNAEAIAKNIKVLINPANAVKGSV